MNASEVYQDRRHAGQLLADHLGEVRLWPRLIVLALPRGGVPVAYEIARSLGAPLDVMLVRKLGVPGHEELAMGAVATGGVRVLNRSVIEQAGISDEVLDAVTRREMEELNRRLTAYRGDAAPSRPSEQGEYAAFDDLAGRSMVLVDDGLATGASMRAANEAAKQHRPAWLAVAVPVGAADTLALLRPSVDALICPRTPTPFLGVGRWYHDFTQTTDDQVRDLLRRRRAEVRDTDRHEGGPDPGAAPA